MSLAAGKLRHRMRLERQVRAQSPTTGAMPKVWQLVAEHIPAAIEPISGKEFLAAAEIRNDVTVRVTVRWRSDLIASMRLIDESDGAVYNIAAVLPDPVSNREYITLPCSVGLNDG
jgi:SPP1 family predicted phage head-tail adaptor